MRPCKYQCHAFCRTSPKAQAQEVHPTRGSEKQVPMTEGHAADDEQELAAAVAINAAAA